MKIKKITLIISIIFMVLININLINSLEMLEPISKDITYSNIINIGYVAPEEPFLLSFLINKNEDYNKIYIEDDIKNIIIEPIKRTEESIFTTVTISNKIKGPYILVLKLDGSKSKKIFLKMNVTNNVITPILMDYKKKLKYNEIEHIKFKIINKSITTKKVWITSDLEEYWFDNKSAKKLRSYLIQPNSIKEVEYTFITKTINEKNIKIYILNENKKINPYTDKENYNIKINTIKNLQGIVESFKYFFPMFGINVLPTYYFNKIIKKI